MKIETSFVNTPIKDYFSKINWRHTMNYAAAINDDNSYYFDDERAEGIVAPPMFAVAITWPITENLAKYIQADNFPIKVMKTIVHYTEHLIFSRLIRPDDELIVKGKIAAIFPHRAGTQIISRFDAIDKNNNPVFTEHVSGMLRGVNCVGEGQGEESLPEVPINKDNSNPLWKKSIAINRLQSFIYDGCTNIFFPIHTSKKFARFVGLPDIILQGTATLAFAVKELTNKEANGNPHCVKEISCKFTDMVMPGTNIEVQLIKRKNVEHGAELYFEVYNSRSKKAISNGYVLIKN